MASDRVATRTTDILVELQVPAGRPYQLIYRMRRTAPFDVPDRDDVEFRFAAGLSQFLPLAKPLQRLVSGGELARSVVRMSVGRMFYGVLRDGGLLHRGWINIAFCRHYRVEPDEVVIGPIWTSPEARGLGLGKYATQCAINVLMERGLSVFYIDTSSTNAACQKMIASCGFGPAMGCMPRGPD